MIRELLARESEKNHPSLQKSLRRRSARQAGEIDSYLDWQDLSPDLVNLAPKAGCRISPGTDVTGRRGWRFSKSAWLSCRRETRQNFEFFDAGRMVGVGCRRSEYQ